MLIEPMTNKDISLSNIAVYAGYDCHRVNWKFTWADSPTTDDLMDNQVFNNVGDSVYEVKVWAEVDAT